MSFFDTHFRRIAGASARSITVLGAATAGAFAAATHPVAASAALNALASAVSCATSAACVTGTNSGSGPGVAGMSAKGLGVQGKSTTGSGVFGSAISGVGVFGQTTNDVGVYGIATDAKSRLTEGVVGISVNGLGLYGAATGTGTGVEGKGGFAGVFGTSETGFGVEALSNSSRSAAALVTNSGGGDGIDAKTICSSQCNATAVQAQSAQGFGYYGFTGNNGRPLTLQNDDLGRVVFEVSSSGDVFYAGGLQNLTRVSNGATVRSYSARTSMPIIEDFGTAQLVGGSAAVRLEPTFAASLDARTAYRVFLTPNGDTRGLYIASKTPAGFIVRETGGGHGSLSFDYRIVATALGQSGQRMEVVNPASLLHVTLPSAQPLKMHQPLPALP